MSASLALEILDKLIVAISYDEAKDVEYILPSDFGNDSNAAQKQEVLIMANCIFNLWKSKHFLNIKEASFSQQIHYFLEHYQSLRENKNLVLSTKIINTIHCILNHYNYYIRLKLESLPKMEKLFTPSLLPPPTASEIVISETWINASKTDTQNQWISHGYYYKAGTGPKYSDLCVDYDCLEDKFVKLTKAKVVMVDYNLLRNDFNSHLKEISDKQVDDWLLQNCAYFAQGQIHRMLMKYENNKTENIDIDHYLQFDESLTIHDFIDTNKLKSGLRQRGGGRAATFLVGNEYKITENGVLLGDMLDVKGVGTHILCADLDQKKNGFLSAHDAFVEFAFQKLIQRIFDIERVHHKNKHSWNTVQMYAIIDTGLRFKSDVENPATGYKGDKIALLIRQRHSRLSASCDEPCFFSVAQYKQLSNTKGKQLRDILLKYGISSEQSPLSYLLRDSNEYKQTECQLGGEWNIQTDATFSHLVDFSQFYCLPNHKTKQFKYKLALKQWRMSMNAFQTGCKLGRVIDQFGEQLSDEMLMDIFGDNNEKQNDLNDIKKKIKSEQEILKDKYGSLVGLIKPKHSWSWFLETDDSEIFKWAQKQVMDLGNNVQQSDDIFAQIPIPDMHNSQGLTSI